VLVYKCTDDMNTDVSYISVTTAVSFLAKVVIKGSYMNYIPSVVKGGWIRSFTISKTVVRIFALDKSNG
jgi:hypothetical protein